MGDGETAAPPPATIRPQVGLMLSIGEPPAGSRNHPKKLDHFRPKPGSEGQYAEAVEKFEEVYGETPKTVDVVLLSNSIGDSLDIRWKAWGTSGLKAIGQTNYAECSVDELPARIAAADDVLTTFPDDQAAPGTYRMRGPDDPAIAKAGLKVYAVFRFALHRVTGMTTLCEISTTSKRSYSNLLSGMTQLHDLTGGFLRGIPCRLRVRPTRGRYFDQAAGKRKGTTFYELVFETPYSVDEFFAEAGRRRAQIESGGARLELPPVTHDDAHRDREIAEALWSNPEREAEDEVPRFEPPEAPPPGTVDEDVVEPTDYRSPDDLATSDGDDEPEDADYVPSADPEPATPGGGDEGEQTQFPIPDSAKRHVDHG